MDIRGNFIGRFRGLELRLRQDPLLRQFAQSLPVQLGFDQPRPGLLDGAGFRGIHLVVLPLRWQPQSSSGLGQKRLRLAQLELIVPGLNLSQQLPLGYRVAQINAEVLEPARNLDAESGILTRHQLSNGNHGPGHRLTGSLRRLNDSRHRGAGGLGGRGRALVTSGAPKRQRDDPRDKESLPPAYGRVRFQSFVHGCGLR